jgi:hypothetical protein
MFYKISFIIILFLTIHQTACLKTTDFCLLKQENQEQECKGFYDRFQNYQTKCEKIQCHGTFNFQCGNNICSNTSAECSEYDKMYFHLKKILLAKSVNPFISTRRLKEQNKIKSFNKKIKYCPNKMYEFKSDDFCMKRRACKISISHLSLMKKQISCRCPASKSFICEKYCAVNSIACDYLKSIKNNDQFASIKDCDNKDITYFRPFFPLW